MTLRIAVTALFGALVCLTLVTALSVQAKDTPLSPLTPEQQAAWRATLASGDYAAIARAYADYMIEHGRDRYGKVHTPLFVSTLNRKTGKPFEQPFPRVITKPYAPGMHGLVKMRPQDRAYVAANLFQDIPLYGLLYRFSDVTGEPRYAAEADKSITWFLEHGWSKATGLPGWGSHMSYDVEKDEAVFSSKRRPSHGYGGHEYNHVWPYWDQSPQALQRFAKALWKHQIKDHETGHFNRHSTSEYGGKEFQSVGACLMDIWLREYARSGDPEMKGYVQTLLKLYRSMRDPVTGAMANSTREGIGKTHTAYVPDNLYMATVLQDAATLIEKRDPELAHELRVFVRIIDDEYLSNDYDKILDVANKGIMTSYTIDTKADANTALTTAPEGVDASVGFPLRTVDNQPATSIYYLTPWFPGRNYAEFSIFLFDRYKRCEAKHKAKYRRALIDIADIYMTIGPEVQFVLYPDNIADVVALLRHVYKLTDNIAYLHRADQMMRLGVTFFFDETSPLPKITNFDDWYESSLKNESSIEIVRQMLELSLDLEKLPKVQRSPVHVVAQKRDEGWHASLPDSHPSLMIEYDPKHQQGLHLAQFQDEGRRRITLSDVITRIPTTEEADKLNGEGPQGYVGKYTEGNLEYGGLKQVPVQVTLVLRNTGNQPAKVRVEARLHDTYHENGALERQATLKPGEQTSLSFKASNKKWIRRILLSGEGYDQLRLEGVSFVSLSRRAVAAQSLVAGSSEPAQEISTRKPVEPVSSLWDGKVSTIQRRDDAQERRLFEELDKAAWKSVFADPCTGDWKKNWFLDGVYAKVSTSEQGMTLDGTQSPGVLWTQEHFTGNLKIEYDFKVVDNSHNHSYNVLLIQATGKGVRPYAEDISKWSNHAYRRVAAMRIYYGEMHSYVITYASRGTRYGDFIQPRRYRAGPLEGTEISSPNNPFDRRSAEQGPEYRNTGLFNDHQWIHVTVIKKHKELFMQFEHPKKTMLFRFVNDKFPGIDKGRIGLRLQDPRVSRFKNFTVSVPAK